MSDLPLDRVEVKGFLLNPCEKRFKGFEFCILKRQNFNEGPKSLKILAEFSKFGKVGFN